MATWSPRGTADDDARRASRSALAARDFWQDGGGVRRADEAREGRLRTHDVALVPCQRRPVIPQLGLELCLVFLVCRLRLELHLLDLHTSCDTGVSQRAVFVGELRARRRERRTISSASSSSRSSLLKRFLRSSATPREVSLNSLVRRESRARRASAARRTSSERVSLVGDLVCDAVEDSDEVCLVLCKDGRVHGGRG